MEFRRAYSSDLNAVAALYSQAKMLPFCAWNEEYPTRIDAGHDCETGNLYVLTDNGAVIGALSVVPENEIDDLPDWHVRGQGVREIARVVVSPSHQGHGYAKMMLAEICDMLRCRGERAVHISVAVDNIPAMRTYPRVGFIPVGEADLFGGRYVLMEREL